MNAREVLTEAPYRGSLPAIPPTDPLIYRFYELIQVYGTTWKELIQEEFGDGIMSAIDFSMDIKRQPDPKGGRRRAFRGAPWKTADSAQIRAGFSKTTPEMKPVRIQKNKARREPRQRPQCPLI